MPCNVESVYQCPHPTRDMRNPFDLISHVPVRVFDLDLESGGVKLSLSHLWHTLDSSTIKHQMNVSLVYANIDRHRIRMLNLPQFIVVCLTFSPESIAFYHYALRPLLHQAY